MEELYWIPLGVTTEALGRVAEELTELKPATFGGVIATIIVIANMIAIQDLCSFHG